MANVLITGCSSGFGQLAALKFARGGDNVFATMRTVSKARPLEEARDKEGLKITILQLDVTDDASVDAAVKAAIAQAGGIDVLVNNAGAELRAPVEQATDEEVRWQFETNVFGLLRVVRAVAPHMRERGSGTIINLSSVTGIVGVPFAGMYSASKHAVEAITEVMHFEMSPFGVRVAAVEPGAFPTEFGSNIRVGSKFTEDSPYYDFFTRFHAAREKIAPGETPDPQAVADTIYDAAYSETPKLRHLVGNDAKLIVGARKALPDFEAYEQAMRTTMDWHD